MKKVLNAGCGYVPLFQNPYAEKVFHGWQETRLDINKSTKPDIVSDILNIKTDSNSFDAVYSQHVLEHLFTHEVEIALKEFYKVLKKGGFVALFLPDFEKIIKAYNNFQELEKVLYVSSGGPIRIIDMIFGYENAIRRDNNMFMMHKTAFTEQSIRTKLDKSGFCNIEIKKDLYDFWVTAYKF